MKKHLLLMIIAICAIITLTKQNSSKEALSELETANIEALSGTEGSSNNNQYERYKNQTDKTVNKEFKTEIETSDTGVKINVEYKRTCVTYYTYCKSTGKKQDICYSSLNELVTTCDKWTKD